MYIILSLKLGDQKGLTVFTNGWLLRRTLLVVLPVILMHIPICAFLSSGPIYY